MTKTKFSFLQLVVTCYVSVNLLGCVTSQAMKQANAYANRAPKLWSIEDVSFAAIRDSRYVRLCAKLRNSSTEVVTEINIDIQDAVEQLESQQGSQSSHLEGQKLEKIDSDEESGYVPCQLELQSDEQNLAVIARETQQSELSAILQEIGKAPSDHAALYLVHHNGSRHLVFNSPLQMERDPKGYAFDCYAEDQTESARYLLLPLTIVGDAVMVGAGIALAIIRCFPTLFFIPICVPIVLLATDSSGRSFPRLYEDASEKIFPLPPETVDKNCD